MNNRSVFVILGTVLFAIVAACGDSATSVPSATQTTSPAATTAVPSSTSTPTPTTVSGTPTTAPEPTGTPADANVTNADIKDFTHQDLTVEVGTTVVWTQQDGVPHTTTSGTPSDPDGLWDSDTLRRGDTFSFTFGEAGEFKYYCRIHPSSMRATITVGAGSEEATVAPKAEPTATPAPTSTPTPPPDTPTPEPGATETPTTPPTPTTSPTPTPTPVPTDTPAPTATPTLEPTSTPEPTPTAPSEPEAPPETVELEISGFAHKSQTVNVGTRIVWVNVDPAPHTATSGTPSDETGLWDTGTISDGQSSSLVTFDTPGTFSYFCRIHPSMRATITVSG